MILALKGFPVKGGKSQVKNHSHQDQRKHNDKTQLLDLGHSVFHTNCLWELTWFHFFKLCTRVEAWAYNNTDLIFQSDLCIELDIYGIMYSYVVDF